MDVDRREGSGPPGAPRRATTQLPRRVLLVGDDPSDVGLVREALAESGHACALESVARLADAMTRIAENPPDCLLLDLAHPDAGDLGSLARLVDRSPDLPIVALTGPDLHEQTSLHAVSLGAQDYVSKGYLAGPLLWRTICYAFERKRLETAVLTQSLLDPLTGLANRRGLVARIERAVARLRDEPGLVAVVYVDLDRFKWVNDSLGHRAGDQLLVAVAERLLGEVRAPDLLARLSGDEFVAFAERVPSTGTALAVAERFLTAMAAPFRIEGTEIWVSVSIGVAVTTDPQISPDRLIQQADMAMFRAKRRGGGGLEIFDESFGEAFGQRLRLLSDLHRAVVRNEFVVDYQPVCDLASGETVAAEALVRWRRADGRLVEPSDFIHLAEETGLILPIGDLVLEDVCQRLATWSDAESAAHAQGLNVNVSTRQLADPQFIVRVRDILGRTGADPARLGLEITETAMSHNEAGMLTQFQDLKALGIRLLLDDFGTGYSSLAYLQLFPFDVLKIDRSFVSRLTEADDHDSRLVKAIIHLGEALGLEIIAEGVETQAIADRLLDLGCTLAQGYHLGRPDQVRHTTPPAHPRDRRPLRRVLP